MLSHSVTMKNVIMKITYKYYINILSKYQNKCSFYPKEKGHVFLSPPFHYLDDILLGTNCQRIINTLLHFHLKLLVQYHFQNLIIDLIQSKLMNEVLENTVLV